MSGTNRAPTIAPSIELIMQIGIFSIGENLRDLVSGNRPTEQEHIKAMVRAANHAEEAGLDVFAIGEHHNPPYVPSSPTILGYIAARTRKIILSTATMLITTNDPVKIAEDYATLGERIVPVLRKELGGQTSNLSLSTRGEI